MGGKETQPMEAIVLKAVARELANELPARVQAVQQPSPRELVLLVRGGAERRLLISTDPEAPRLHLLVERPASLPSPTAFCRLLRKRLEGRVLVRVECPGVERSVTLAFAAPRGAEADLLLVAELMGKHSNLILVEVATGLVVDSLQHVSPPMSRVRTVLPGLPYTPPPASGRVALDALDAPAFAALWRETGGNPEALFRRVLGLGPGLLALALGHARRAPGFADDPGAAVHAALRECAARVDSGATRPVFYPERGVLLPLPVPGWESEPQVAAPSMSEAAAAFYAQRIGRRAGDRRRGELSRELGRGLKRLTAEESLRREEAAAEGEVAFLQAAAGGLAAAAATVPKGATAFVFDDPRTGASREVPLDPALGPRQNAEALFRRARKIRRRSALAAQKLPAIIARRRLLEEELALVATLPPEALVERLPAAGAVPGKPAATAAHAGNVGEDACRHQGVPFPGGVAYPRRQKRRRQRPSHGADCRAGGFLVPCPGLSRRARGAQGRGRAAAGGGDPGGGRRCGLAQRRPRGAAGRRGLHEEKERAQGEGRPARESDPRRVGDGSRAPRGSRRPSRSPSREIRRCVADAQGAALPGRSFRGGGRGLSRDLSAGPAPVPRGRTGAAHRHREPRPTPADPRASRRFSPPRRRRRRRLRRRTRAANPSARGFWSAARRWSLREW